MKSEKNFAAFMRRRDASVTHELTIIIEESTPVATPEPKPVVPKEPEIPIIRASDYNHITWVKFSNTDLPDQCDELRKLDKLYRDQVRMVHPLAKYDKS